MFSLYFDFLILVISCFGSEDWIWVLIASVPNLFILFYRYTCLLLLYSVISLHANSFCLNRSQLFALLKDGGFILVAC